MKRLLAVFSVLIICAFSVCGAEEGDGMQLVIPKQVYVGDTAEIQYVFHSDANIFSENDTTDQKQSLQLRTDGGVFDSVSELCLVQSAVIRRSGSEYTLVLKIIPWQSGILDFPPFDLSQMIRRTLSAGEKTESSGQGMASGGLTSYPIDLVPVAVNSLVEKMHVTSFRPPVPPLVVPGTTWMVYGAIILLIILIIAFVIFIRRFSLVSSFWNAFWSSIGYKRNAYAAQKKLRRLLQAECDDAEFCCLLQSILRTYLAVRFDEKFESETTRTFNRRFLEIMGGSLSPEQEMCVDTMTEIFFRTDYVRFARGSLESRREPAERYAAALVPGERATIVSSAVQTINSFEGKDKKNDEYSDGDINKGGSHAGI